MPEEIKALVKHTYKNSNWWSEKNPVLMSGEVGYISDISGKYKVGDGVSAWNELDYADSDLENYEGYSRSDI